MNKSEYLRDSRHKYCSVCNRRLDKVKSFNKIKKEELLKKLNKLKPNVEVGDLVCGRCTSSARSAARRNLFQENNCNSLVEQNIDTQIDDKTIGNQKDCLYNCLEIKNINLQRLSTKMKL